MDRKRKAVQQGGRRPRKPARIEDPYGWIRCCGRDVYVDDVNGGRCKRCGQHYDL